MKTLYVAEDGTQFENEEDCLKRDQEIIAAKEQEEKLANEKKARYEEVKKAYGLYKKLEEAYIEDYGHISLVYGDKASNWFEDDINTLFNKIFK